MCPARVERSSSLSSSRCSHLEYEKPLVGAVVAAAEEAAAEELVEDELVEETLVEETLVSVAGAAGDQHTASD